MSESGRSATDAPEAGRRSAGNASDAGRPVLEARALTKSYREGERTHPVLRGASLTVRRGEFVVLLGPSGSGKSTFLNLVSGIDLPDDGEVRLDGRPLTGMGERERTLLRRRSIGFVFQFYNLLPTLTVEENLLLPLELAGRIPADAGERIRALLDELGLGDRAGSFPDRLSGGEQQRIAVARALIHRPSLVLADEPTGNLDAGTGARVLDLLEAMTRRAERSLLVVTHAADVAARGDRVLRLRDGVLSPVASDDLR